MEGGIGGGCSTVIEVACPWCGRMVEEAAMHECDGGYCIVDGRESLTKC